MLTRKKCVAGPMVVMAALAVTSISLVSIAAAPVSWGPRLVPEVTPATVMPWEGHSLIPGAFLLSRINLEFLNHTCNKLSNSMAVAVRVSQVINQFKIKGASQNEIKRYGYILLKVETEIKGILAYVSSLLLCSYDIRSDIWHKYRELKELLKTTWRLLRAAGKPTRIMSDSSNSFTTARPFNQIMLDPLDLPVNVNNTPHTPLNRPAIRNTDPTNLLTGNNSNNSLIDYLEDARPDYLRQPRSPLAIGLGLGFLGSLIMGKYFDTNNDREIELINQNIRKQTNQLLVTNRRIDMLAKNVSNSFEAVTGILNKLVDAQQTTDIHLATLWSLDELSNSITELTNSFKLSEITITLLDDGILNPDLVDMNSFRHIIEEGRNHFPDYNFAINITRINLIHIVKILKVQRVGHLKYLMVIPLTQIAKYKVYTLIAHPVNLDDTTLVLPKINDIILKFEDSYIITQKTNLYSISHLEHLLLELEPVYHKSHLTCEWAGFHKNTTAMLSLCNYIKVGHMKDTFVVETDKHRLVYFPQQTKVALGCPDRHVHDTLEGLHRVPIACDVQTDHVFWPAKQTAHIDVRQLDDEAPMPDLITIPVPSIYANESSHIHDSLRELIDKLPKKHNPLTFDFNYHDLSLEEVQTYSIYAQSILTVFVIINSILIGIIYAKWIYQRKPRLNNFVHDFRDSSLANKFRGLRDSIRSRRDSFRNARDSIRSGRRSLKRQLKNKLSRSPTVSNVRMPTTTVHASTNTDDVDNPPPFIPEVYPALPRYN